MFKALDYLKQFRLIDSEHVINNYLKEGKSVLAEGAQALCWILTLVRIRS